MPETSDTPRLAQPSAPPPTALAAPPPPALAAPPPADAAPPRGAPPGGAFEKMGDCRADTLNCVPYAGEALAPDQIGELGCDELGDRLRGRLDKRARHRFAERGQELFSFFAPP